MGVDISTFFTDEDEDEEYDDSIQVEATHQFETGNFQALSTPAPDTLSSLLYNSLLNAKQFIPAYAKDLTTDYGTPELKMHSLEDYITTAHPQYALGAGGWSLCEKCTLEGAYKGTRVWPSVVRLDTTPLPSSPINLLIIGEAPGAEELQSGFGFVGISGALLMRYLAQLWAETLPPMIFGNAVLCRPKDNITPTISQYKKCGRNFWPYLLTDHNLIADDCLIISIGSISYKMLFSIADGTPAPSNILAAHGRPTELAFRNPNDENDLRTFTLMPMIHPAYILRSPTPERYELIKNDAISAYNFWCDVQDTGKVDMAAFLKQDSANSVDLDKDISGDLYTHALTDDEIEVMMAIIESDYKDMGDHQKIVSYDIETTSIDTQNPDTTITLAGIGTIRGHTFQFEEDAIPAIGKVFASLKKKGYYLVGHNIWFDLIMSWKTGIFKCVDELPDLRDTRVMHKLIDENSTDNKLKWLCQRYFGIADWSAELNMMTDSEGKVQWAKLDDEKRKALRKYHKGDLYWTVKLCYLFIDKIADPSVSQYWKIDYVDFKCQLLKELLQTSINGFLINKSSFEELKEEYEEQQHKILNWFKQPLYYRVVASLRVLDKAFKEVMQKTLCNFAIGDTYDEKKDEFNPNSTQHIAALISAVLSSDDNMRQKVIKGLGRKGKTAKGKISLNEASLEKISETLKQATTVLGGANPHKYEHLIASIEKALEFRRLKKIVSTYLEGMQRYVWPDGSVRAQWNVDGAATGRMSCIAKGTLIACADGADKLIEEIKPGDMVYCYDESNRLVKRPVLELIDQGERECVMCTWEFGVPHETCYLKGVLVCTPDHKLREVGLFYPFYSWITPEKSWKDGLSSLWGRWGGRYKIIDVEPCGVHHVYDLSIEEHHNFIANGLSVHNCIAEGTLIYLGNGTSIPVEKVKAWHDEVFCYDEDNIRQVRPIVSLIDQGMKKCIVLKWTKSLIKKDLAQFGLMDENEDITSVNLEISDSLICTPDHKLRVVNTALPEGFEWVEAQDCLYREVYGLGGTGYKICEILPDTKPRRRVYDLSVDAIHNFIANGLCLKNCARPNLQQIPRGDTAKGIKRMFVPRYEGYVLMQFDLSQAELRGLGSFSHDPNLKRAYDQGLDLHTYTAANMWHEGDTEKVSKHERSIAKTIYYKKQ